MCEQPPVPSVAANAPVAASPTCLHLTSLASPAVCPQRVLLPPQRHHRHVLGCRRLQRLLGPLLLPAAVWPGRARPKLSHAAAAVWRHRRRLPGKAALWCACLAGMCTGKILDLVADVAAMRASRKASRSAAHSLMPCHGDLGAQTGMPGSLRTARLAPQPPLPDCRREPPTSSSPMVCSTPGAAVSGTALLLSALKAVGNSRAIVSASLAGPAA